eukprot:3794068-Karenia_brevis.AAC.1
MTLGLIQHRKVRSHPRDRQEHPMYDLQVQKPWTRPILMQIVTRLLASQISKEDKCQNPNYLHESVEVKNCYETGN